MADDPFAQYVVEEEDPFAQYVQQDPLPPAVPQEKPGFWDSFAYGFDKQRSVTEMAIDEAAVRFRPDEDAGPLQFSALGAIPGASALGAMIDKLRRSTPEEQAEAEAPRGLHRPGSSEQRRGPGRQYSPTAP